MNPLEELSASLTEMPAEELPRLLGELEHLKAKVQARLLRLSAGGADSAGRQEADRLLKIADASARLGMSEAYLYRNWKNLPFTVRQGRRLLFSSEGIADYIRRRREPIGGGQTAASEPPDGG